jgi:hypothetical protein
VFPLDEVTDNPAYDPCAAHRHVPEDLPLTTDGFSGPQYCQAIEF